jgi:glutaredoxin 3
MADVVVYATPYCFYCLRAKKLLAKKGVEFREIDVGGDGEARGRLADTTGSHRVPQIFINGSFVGGYYELWSMERAGELDSLLTSEPASQKAEAPSIPTGTGGPGEESAKGRE